VPHRDTRRLSAILAADVVGYSRLMAAEEAGTVARLKAHRFELIDPAIAKNRGRIFKTTGDGLLAEFASAVHAVECAVEIQRRMARRNSDMPAEQRIDFRMGINVGDVIVDGDDLQGDGVNIATRLEGIAEPGGIVISRAAREQVRDKLGFGLDELGEIPLKNIPRPVRAFRVRIESDPMDIPLQAAAPSSWQRPALAASVVVVAIVAGLAWWQVQRPVPPAAIRDAGPPPAPSASPPAAPAPQRATALPQLPASIAPPVVAERAALIVLPFANLSGDPQQEYFSDGITEDITTALARIPGFLVMARNTAFTLKGKAVDAQDVGAQFGVRYVLEGSVQKQSNRLRLNAQLIDAATGNHVWAERFDRPVADLFIVQDELADKIVGTVAATLRRREGERALAAPPEKLEAHELTMRARILRNSAGRDATLEARRLARQAIDRDPSFAPAYIQLARAAYTIRVNRWNEEFNSPAAAAQMIEATTKAIALAPNDAYARATHGMALTFFQRWDEALAEADWAVTRSPNDPDVLNAASVVTQWSGRYDQTVELGRRLVVLDPFVPPANVGNILGGALYLLGRHGEAKEAARYCVERSPSNVRCREHLTAFLGWTGPEADARAQAAELLRLSPGYTISEYLRVTTFNDPTAASRIAEGLRKAGVPE
jgi:adenylate cyclase